MIGGRRNKVPEKRRRGGGRYGNCSGSEETEEGEEKGKVLEVTGREKWKIKENWWE